MEITIEDITGQPPYHLYKNARALSLTIRCNCGFKGKKVLIVEDKKREKNENTGTN